MFVGLQGMIDPPRPEAVAAVRACQSAGIQVKMITGDHALTASAIAQQMGLDRTPEPLVFTGAQLAQMDNSQLAQAAGQSMVFARVAPEQKLRLVEALQRQGEIVAMTGDGVNDAPALKQADIGIAMGITGTEVAKEAADMILTDDNFASIEAAVEEGRTVYQNLRKAIAFILPVNGGESMTILIAILLATALPILPLQILWLNMVSSVALTVPLAFEPKDRRVMQRPPRNPNQPLLSGSLLRRILVISAFNWLVIFGIFEWGCKPPPILLWPEPWPSMPGGCRNFLSPEYQPSGPIPAGPTPGPPRTDGLSPGDRHWGGDFAANLLQPIDLDESAI